jgi:hypothetical protein
VVWSWALVLYRSMWQDAAVDSYAGCTARADNTASRRVMEKCGLVFQEEFLYKGALAVWYATPGRRAR